MPVPDVEANAPYVGSESYNALLGDAPSANLMGVIDYTSPLTTVTRVTMNTLDLAIKGTKYTIHIGGQLLKAGGSFAVWLHSDPQMLGMLTADAQGSLSGEVPIPEVITPGYHTLHVIGKDIAGDDIDMYQTVYVAASMDDYNGDGVPNDQDPCLLVPNSPSAGSTSWQPLQVKPSKVVMMPPRIGTLRPSDLREPK